MSFEFDKIISNLKINLGQTQKDQTEKPETDVPGSIFDAEGTTPEVEPTPIEDDNTSCNEIFGFKRTKKGTTQATQNNLNSILKFLPEDDDLNTYKEEILKLDPKEQELLSKILESDANELLKDVPYADKIEGTKREKATSSTIETGINTNGDGCMCLKRESPHSREQYYINPENNSIEIKLVQLNNEMDDVASIVTKTINSKSAEMEDVITAIYTEEGELISFIDNKKHIKLEAFYKDKKFDPELFEMENFYPYYADDADYNRPTRMKTEYYDDNWNLLKTETITQNEALRDCPTITVTYPDGKTEALQYGSYDPKSQAKYVEKHFESSEGVRTDYTYEESPDNVKIINYKITAPERVGEDGKQIPPQVLMEHNYTWQQVSDNHIISTTNGHGYDILIKENTLTVTDMQTKEENEIEIPITILDNYDKDKQKEILMECIKSIPGNQMFLLNDLNSILYNDESQESNAFYTAGKIVLEKRDDPTKELLSAFIHEYGHLLDLHDYPDNGVLSSNEEIQSIYQEELKNFKQNSTPMQRSYLDHMISDGFAEGVGDTNTILHTDSTRGHIGLRLFYFQKCFPRTIAAIANYLTKGEGEIRDLYDKREEKLSNDPEFLNDI